MVKQYGKTIAQAPHGIGSRGLSAAILIGCDNRETILVIEKPTEVRSIEQSPTASASASAGLEPGKVVATLKPGEMARVIGVYHGKDFDAFQVKLADGMEGLIVAGDTFKVGPLRQVIGK